MHDRGRYGAIVEIFETERCRFGGRNGGKFRQRKSSLRKHLRKRLPAIDKSMFCGPPKRPSRAEQLPLFRIEIGSTQNNQASSIQEDRESPEACSRLVEGLNALSKVNQVEAFDDFQD